MNGSQRFDPWAAIGKPNPNAAAMTEAEEKRQDTVVEDAERKSITAEPKLPELQTEERRIINLRQERMVRGLLAAAKDMRK
jgi:hypothetical protein